MSSLTALPEQHTSRENLWVTSEANTPSNKENCFYLQGDDSPQRVVIPAGCIVRNTFLEWQEETDEIKHGNSEMCLLVVPSDAASKRRSKSCPENVLKPRNHSNSPSSPGSTCTPEADSSTNGEDGCSDAVTCNSPKWDAVEQRREYTTHSSQWGRSPHGGGMANALEGGSHDGFGSQNLKNFQKSGQPAASCVLVLRGLPFNSCEADVAMFIQHAGASQALASGKAITLLSNASGKPSGFAEVQLKRDANFWEIQEKLHMQRLGGRYIEVLPPRGAGQQVLPPRGTGGGRRQWRDRSNRVFA